MSYTPSPKRSFSRSSTRRRKWNPHFGQTRWFRSTSLQAYRVSRQPSHLRKSPSPSEVAFPGSRRARGALSFRNQSAMGRRILTSPGREPARRGSERHEGGTVCERRDGGPGRPKSCESEGRRGRSRVPGPEARTVPRARRTACVGRPGGDVDLVGREDARTPVAARRPEDVEDEENGGAGRGSPSVRRGGGRAAPPPGRGRGRPAAVRLRRGSARRAPRVPRRRPPEAPPGRRRRPLGRAWKTDRGRGCVRAGRRRARSPERTARTPAEGTRWRGPPSGGGRFPAAPHRGEPRRGWGRGGPRGPSGASTFPSRSHPGARRGALRRTRA